MPFTVCPNVGAVVVAGPTRLPPMSVVIHTIPPDVICWAIVAVLHDDAQELFSGTLGDGSCSQLRLDAQVARP